MVEKERKVVNASVVVGLVCVRVLIQLVSSQQPDPKW